MPPARAARSRAGIPSFPAPQARSARTASVPATQAGPRQPTAAYRRSTADPALGTDARDRAVAHRHLRLRPRCDAPLMTCKHLALARTRVRLRRTTVAVSRQRVAARMEASGASLMRACQQDSPVVLAKSQRCRDAEVWQACALPQGHAPSVASQLESASSVRLGAAVALEGNGRQPSRNDLVVSTGPPRRPARRLGPELRPCSRHADHGRPATRDSRPAGPRPRPRPRRGSRARARAASRRLDHGGMT